MGIGLNGEVAYLSINGKPFGLGAAVGTVGALTGLGIMAIPGVGPIVAAGWLVATLAGAAADGATGGVIGARHPHPTPYSWRSPHHGLVTLTGPSRKVSLFRGKSPGSQNSGDFFLAAPPTPRGRSEAYRNTGISTALCA